MTDIFPSTCSYVHLGLCHAESFGHSVAKFTMLVLAGGMIPIVSVQRQGRNIRFVCFG